MKNVVYGIYESDSTNRPEMIALVSSKEKAVDYIAVCVEDMERSSVREKNADHWNARFFYDDEKIACYSKEHILDCVYINKGKAYRVEELEVL